MTSALKLALATVAGLAIGVAIGVRIGGDAPSPRTADSLPVDVTADESGGAASPLRSQLEREQHRRAALEIELSRLRATPRTPVAPEPDGERETPAEDEIAQVDEEKDSFFDEASLREAGVSEAEIRRLRDIHDGLELDLLYLRDAARREGWLRTGRFRRETRLLRASLRGEIGDDDYDAMLYAGGRNNRVIVADVLANSAAARTGLEPSDTILRYGDERIFDVASLTRATSRARPGDLIEVRIWRDGREERVFLPSGPIGVRLRRGRQQPDTLR